MWFEALARLDDRSVATVALLWGADPASLELVNHGINVVYRGKAHDRAIYLRFTHLALRDQEHLALPVDFLCHAAACGAPVCTPLKSVNSRFIEEVWQGEDLFLATAILGVPGQPIDPAQAHAALLHEWGYALGLLHTAAETYVQRLGTVSHHWERQWAHIRPYLESDATLLAEYQAITAWTKTLPIVDFGLCHADFRAANCLWDGERVWIIDFDEPTYCWFAYDMARALMEFSDLELEERRRKMEWLLKGYGTARPFNPDPVLEMGWFVRMRTLLMYAWGFEDGAGTNKLASGMGSGHYLERIRNPLVW
ncbi:phosphotransferase [uncultured Meiothermus sp.]|jgi:Ser/Thr protein kinase RdoA (MazF antagonist)|uniref:phosphotransferase enzyme family protein n=1 Tax=uncultured Meiothermus sp. TaxID=157471 RepID=UPI0026215805|nr:phosphotransferase [uncultured Meiothermus sp.]